MALFALPLAGGAAWAQGSGTSGSAGAPGGTTQPSVTDDTRTPTQQKAGRVDDAQPLPGDATRPIEVPGAVPESPRSGMPDAMGVPPAPPKVDESTLPRRSDADHDPTAPTSDDKRGGDLSKDQLDSDK
ncbi:MAG TPA: hypothetical protein VF945_04165 [Polyangia bacterium]